MDINNKNKIALYGGCFNPPGLHHRQIVQALLREFDEVIVVPCGHRADKKSTNNISPVHRKNMVILNFGDLGNVKFDFFDIDNDVFTPNHLLEQKYMKNGEVWHVVGADLARGGGDGKSQIQRTWQHGAQLWKNLNFFVLCSLDRKMDEKDLPPHNRTAKLDIKGSSTKIRKNISIGESSNGSVSKKIEQYIKKNGLYKD